MIKLGSTGRWQGHCFCVEDLSKRVGRLQAKQSCEYAFECGVIGGLATEYVTLLRIAITLGSS
jgi:hypothetical protein